MLIAACSPGGGSADTSSSAQNATSGTVQRPNPAPSTPPAPQTTPATPSAQPITADIRLEWTAPTQREDGSPIAPSELTGYEVVTVNLNTGRARTYQIPDADRTSVLLESFGVAPFGVYLFVYDLDNALSDPVYFEISVDDFPVS